MAMRRILHIAGRLAVLVFMAVWFQTVTHVDVCHGGEASDEHGNACSGSIACSCVCHTPMAPVEEPVPCIVQTDEGGVEPMEQLVHTLLLPSDIFRPPVAHIG